MDRNEPARPSLTAFVKVINKTSKSRRLANRTTLRKLWRPEVRDELNLQDVAVLSDN